jgi:Xaa-Pro dipeptidase
MNFLKKLATVRKVLQEENIDGWLLYDFRRCNPHACRFLGIGNDELLTRRFFVWIGRDGQVHKIVHRIENPLQAIIGEESIYSSWKELHQVLKKVLGQAKRVAMEYSPDAAIPEISRVDGGTIDLVKSFGIEVISSAELLQEFAGIWDSQKLESHYYAIQVLEGTFEKCWNFIRENLCKISEYDVQQFALKQFSEANCLTDCAPICATNQNSANPHYLPEKDTSSIIKRGDLIMLDLGCKQDRANSVYGDLTKMAIAGEPSKKQQQVFDTVMLARDTALKYISDKISQNETVRGFEVDDCCREMIAKSGYGKFFTHRTGHSIDEMEHGPGTHLDNLETHDWRKLKPNSCFSIEPGIYLPNEFGIRLECDVILHAKEIEVTGGLQKEFIKI